MNPARMGFGALRVVNDDTIAPGSGFPLHHHEQMEIVTVMLGGVLTHKDSMDNISELRQDEVQVMTAGTGLNHSEWNHDPAQPASLLQIWMYPKVRALMPGYAQSRFDPALRENNFQILVSGIKKDSALFIHQDALIARAHITEGKTIAYTLSNRTHGIFVFVISGTVALGADVLSTRDAIEITDEEHVSITAQKDADVLVIEVPLSV
jgi:redox-sensitive bicupin YhaK (pirin superfamily)